MKEKPYWPNIISRRLSSIEYLEILGGDEVSLIKNLSPDLVIDMFTKNICHGRRVGESTRTVPMDNYI